MIERPCRRCAGGRTRRIRGTWRAECVEEVRCGCNCVRGELGELWMRMMGSVVVECGPRVREGWSVSPKIAGASGRAKRIFSVSIKLRKTAKEKAVDVPLPS